MFLRWKARLARIRGSPLISCKLNLTKFQSPITIIQFFFVQWKQKKRPRKAKKTPVKENSCCVFEKKKKVGESVEGDKILLPRARYVLTQGFFKLINLRITFFTLKEIWEACVFSYKRKRNIFCFVPNFAWEKSVWQIELGRQEIGSWVRAGVRAC